MSFFFRRKVRYLGHVVSDEGIHTDSDEISAVQDFEIPTTINLGNN